MGRGASENDMTIQYCMSLPMHILQSLEIPSVTQVQENVKEPMSFKAMKLQYVQTNAKAGFAKLQEKYIKEPVLKVRSHLGKVKESEIFFDVCCLFFYLFRFRLKSTRSLRFLHSVITVHFGSFGKKDLFNHDLWPLLSSSVAPSSCVDCFRG